MIRLDLNNISLASEEFSRISFKPDEFTDPRLYPPKGDPRENVLRYFLVMVAMDHRTSTPQIEFKSIIDGATYRGAYLLYRLGMLKYYSNPEFFSPRRLSEIGIDEVRNWLTVRDPRGREVTVRDVELRTLLLRDLGVKVLKLYGGEVSKILELSGNRIKGLKPGIVDLLKDFRAYQDPVEKKAFLLIKFLERRGLFTPVDYENAEVPVDNRLTRIALRLGIVVVSDELKEKLVEWKPVSYEDDVVIRIYVRRAFKILSKLSNISPLILDDLLWLIGATWCRRESPECDAVRDVVELNLRSSKCPLRNICYAYRNLEARKLKEHNYYDTWYY